MNHVENFKYIVGNWKMNPLSFKEADHLFSTVEKGVEKIDLKDVEIVVCPPFVFLHYLKEKFALPCADLHLKLGAQNASFERQGAFTGEISPFMLKDLGCEYVILGHSERRQLGEDNEMVAKKIKLAFGAGLKPIVAVGEKEKGGDKQKIATQVNEAIKYISKNQIKDIIWAYEPVWAVVSDEAETPEGAMEGAILIRKILSEYIGEKQALETPILYGGSVDAKNAADFLKQGSLQGLLVGGASINATEFVNIIKSV